jgi:hypothetical protein
MLPNFLVIGAAKAGTTSLYNYLRVHPQVFMSRPKELRFFIAEDNWRRGLPWYEQYFSEAADALAIGEASPQYTRYPYHKGVPARIAKVLPDVQLIYIVRHPINRMLSQYVANARRGQEMEPIEEALLTHPWYIDVSSYAMQVEQYLETFPAHRVLIIKSEDLYENRAATMKRVYGYLGVDPSFAPANLIEDYNATRAKEMRVIRPQAKVISRTLRRIPGYRSVTAVAPAPLLRLRHRITARPIQPDLSLSPAVRQELEARLRPDIERLRTYLGDAFDGWGIA